MRITSTRWNQEPKYIPTDHGKYKTWKRNLKAPAGHAFKGWDVPGMTDVALCECGWISRGYWDGRDLALDEWDEHLENVTYKEKMK